jgi:hypothetical protein
MILISESRDDLNRCIPYRGKPDQHATRIPRSVRVWSQIICISRGPHITTFHESPTDLDEPHCSREKGLPTQSPARRLTDPRIRTQFLFQANHWSSRLKPSFYRWQTTRLTGLISSACDRCVQYLLAGSNPSVLNRHRWGYSLGGVDFPRTTLRPSQLTISHFHLWAPPGIQFNQKPNTSSKI